MKTPVSTHPCQHSLCLLPQDLLNAENVKTTQQTDFGAIISDPLPFCRCFWFVVCLLLRFFFIYKITDKHRVTEQYASHTIIEVKKC